MIRKLKSNRHFNKAVWVVAVAALLTTILGISFNPFLGHFQITSSGFVISFGVLLESIAILAGTALVCAFILSFGNVLHKRKPKLDEFLAAFIIFLVLPIFVFIIAVLLGLQIGSFLLGWAFAYPMLWVMAYVVSKVWTD